MSRLQEVLNGQQDNYILPFFWQHGEDEAVLRDMMRAIHEANIGAVCVEARPHPDFAGPKWWQDLDVIIDEAKKRQMKVWILDDAHFPSGQAAGKMAEQPDEMCKQYLNYHMADICGPVPEATLNVGVMAKYYAPPFEAPNPFAGNAKKREFNDDELMAVIASKLDGDPQDMNHLDDTLLDLTDMVKDGMLTWDVPEGMWRIFVIYKTRKGGGRDNYVNFMSKKSCRIQIDAVYEPHYERYKDEFGKTIAGFFSDEPEIGNMPGYDNNVTVGNIKMPLPWSEEMDALMSARLGADYRRKIPALWMNVGSREFTADIRTGFMDIVSRQCQINFGEQMGDWCREHGVEYIGHILEDCGISTRLGASQGHFFRALRGQDWSGVDDIGGQVTLGGENVGHMRFMGGIDADGEFYHHVLAKLGTSLADIEPKKKGRTMCEMFGAYGWNEGTRLMKYISDHLLVRGINRFVPHAFTAKDFPDPDCPPHFYAHGKNPLYKPFGSLMTYINRISHLIDGGKHKVSAAVLYHAESEWAGMGFMDIVKPARALDDRQIDYDFVPADVFAERDFYKMSLDKDGLHINDRTFATLIVPGAGYIARPVLDFAKEAKKFGFPVYFVSDTLPAAENMISVTLDTLAQTLMNAGICDAVSDVAYDQLQVYHYEQPEECYYLISNEHASRTYCGHVKLPVCGVPYGYDAVKNQLYTLDYETADDGISIALTLEAYQMAVVVIAKDDAAYKAVAGPLPKLGEKLDSITGDWQVSFVENENYPAFGDTVTMERLSSVLKVKPYFSGVIRYENTFCGDGLAGKAIALCVEDAFESVEVWCNDTYVGECICPPYRFDLTDAIKAGDNRLRLEVRTTLERKVFEMTGGMSFFGPSFDVVTPSGIVGNVDLAEIK